MAQIRYFTETNETIARKLQSVFDTAFEEDGFAIATFGDVDDPDNWSVSIYADETESENLYQRLTSLIQDADVTVSFEIENIPDTDWVAKTLQELHPVRAGRYLIHGSHDINAPAANDISVQIDAGLAFGTGHHGTTAGCLDMLSEIMKRQTFRNVLDLGTGSGVLAIAIAKSSQAHIMASDIDPVATTTARENTQINGVQVAVECVTSSGLAHRRFKEQAPFDLVIANILANPLMSMACDISKHTCQGGYVILSGLLPHQRRMILAGFRQHGLIFVKSHIRENWLSMVFKKP